MGQLQSCPKCYNNFSICHPCYRGQKYCSSSCQRSARSAQLKQASQNYQKSQIGKRKHQLRQDSYRKRINKVTHQSSQASKEKVIDKPQEGRAGQETARTLLKCLFCRRNIGFLMNEPVRQPVTYIRRQKDKRKKHRDQHRVKGAGPPSFLH